MCKESNNKSNNFQIGKRIHVIGNSCSGKSTLAEKISHRFAIPLVEIDALNWEPNWIGLHETEPHKLDEKLTEATSSDSWVVAGSYLSFCQRIFWNRLETLIWLDLPLYTLVLRMFIRSWQRWRSKELLWGTNYEKFWPQFKVWKKQESLLWWIVTQHKSKRQKLLSQIKSAHWRHINFIRLKSVSEIKAFSKLFGLR